MSHQPKEWPQKRHIFAAALTVSAHCGQIFVGSGASSATAAGEPASGNFPKQATTSKANTPKIAPSNAQPSALRFFEPAIIAQIAAQITQTVRKIIPASRRDICAPAIIHLRRCVVSFLKTVRESLATRESIARRRGSTSEPHEPFKTFLNILFDSRINMVFNSPQAGHVAVPPEHRTL